VLPLLFVTPSTTAYLSVAFPAAGFHVTVACFTPVPVKFPSL